MKPPLIILALAYSLAAVSCTNRRGQAAAAKAGSAPGDTIVNSADSLVYQTYGLPDKYGQIALYRVFRRYGVEVRSVAGCIVTEELLRRVQENNAAVFTALDKKLGAGAAQRLTTEISAEAGIQERVEQLLRGEKLIQKKEQSLSDVHPYSSLIFTPQPAATDGSFIVDATVAQYVNGVSRNTPWQQFLVDTVKGIVLVYAANGRTGLNTR